MPDRIITAATAQTLQEQAHDERGVLIWIVMEGDGDHPEKFAARPVQSGTGPLHCVLVADTLEYLFEPNPEAFLGYLLSHYFNIFIYLVLLNAKASEQSARMVAMKNATDNANTLIQDLTLEYNKLRQGKITTELLEIVSGQIGSA